MAGVPSLIPTNKITIGGKTGTGTSTLGKLVAQRLGWQFVSGGQIIRNMYAELGVTDAQFKEMRKKDPDYDKMLDDEQVRLGTVPEGVVLESRLGHHFIPNSLKVLLICDDEIRTVRVFERERKLRPALTMAELQREDEERNRSDRVLYANMYGIDDYLDPRRYDMVLNSGNRSPEALSGEVLDRYNWRRNLKI